LKVLTWVKTIPPTGFSKVPPALGLRKFPLEPIDAPFCETLKIIPKNSAALPEQLASGEGKDDGKTGRHWATKLVVTVK